MSLRLNKIINYNSEISFDSTVICKMFQCRYNYYSSNLVIQTDKYTHSANKRLVKVIKHLYFYVCLFRMYISF